MKILLVEDEPEMAAVLCEALTNHGFLIDHTGTLGEAKTAVFSFNYDLIILDRQLPGGDGIKLLKSLRDAGNRVPVLILSARGDLADRIDGLDGGADDYLAKPFDFSELLARIRALVRRPATLQHDKVQAGSLSYDHVNKEASVNGDVLPLTRREQLLLDSLLRRFNRVVPREVLMESIFSFTDQVQPNALDLYISRLRHKLNDALSGLKINVVRGVGYFICEDA